MENVKHSEGEPGSAGFRGGSHGKPVVYARLFFSASHQEAFESNNGEAFRESTRMNGASGKCGIPLPRESATRSVMPGVTVGHHGTRADGDIQTGATRAAALTPAVP